MTSKLKKYSIVSIATVLLIAMAFAGAASAVDITADEWNGLTADQINGNASYSFTGTGTIEPKYIGETAFTPTRDLTFEFTNYQGTFAGVSSASTNDEYKGALFGYIMNTSGPITITIKNLTMNSVNVRPNKYSNNAIGGIIGYFYGKNTGESTLNFTNCQLVNCSIGLYNGGTYVGGLVGAADATSVNVENCSVKHCDVVFAYSHVGGLIGYAGSARLIRGNVTNSTIAGDNVGGLVSSANTASFESCGVENSSVYGSSDSNGGLIGHANTVNGIENCMVKNCVIASSDYSVGGLVGSTNPATNNVENCHVLNCTIAGSEYVGGLVGYTTSANGWSGNYVTNCAVNATSTTYSTIYTNYVCGNLPAMENPTNCSVTGINFIRNTSASQVDTTITPFSSYGWNTIQYVTANQSTKVTNLGIYGKVGGYGVGSYVSPGPTPTSYDIAITNATGTYPLTSALTKVYGDDGIGYANLTEMNTTTGTYTLELNGFNVTNAYDTSKPIINASTANLTIKLVGESNLTGSYEDNIKGLVYCIGNLTITATSSGSKLLVNNTKDSNNYWINSIIVGENLAIENNVTVIAIARDTEYNGASALYSYNADIKISGENTIVNAYASSDDDAYIEAIYANMNVIIEDGATVTITATTFGDNAFAIYAHYGDIRIEDSANVNATATSNDDWAEALYAEYGDIRIEDGATVNAVATSSGNGTTAYGLYSENGNITISDSPNVIATAVASTSTSKAISMDACWDIAISSSTAVVYSDADDKSRGVYAESGKLTVTDSDVTVFANSSSSEAYALATGDYYADITIQSGSNVHAYANSTGYYASGIYTESGCTANITILSSSEVTSIAKSSNDANAIYSGDLTIDNINSLTAISTSSSFVYEGAFDVTGLSDYTFSNASVSGDEPTSYAAFANNWYTSSGVHCSNYTAVKIVKGSGTTDASIKVTISGTNAGTDPVNLTLTPVSTGTSGTYNIGTNKAYLIKPVTPGVYSLDATYTHNSMEHKLTKQVTVTTANRTDVTFNLLTTNVTTDVKTSKGTATDTPKVAVDGLDNVASAIQPAAGQMVNISLSVEGNSDTSTAEQQMLKNNRTYSAGTPSFINFTVTNTTSYVNGTVISNSTMDNLSTVLTIYVAYDMTRENIEVFRIHNGTVENFTETSTILTTPVDRYFAKDQNGIYIYTQKFSSYMISSTARSSPVTPSSGSSSSSHHSGSSQLAKSQDVYVTPEPTAVPTQGPTTVITSSPTASSTTQPTQSSPAPIAGLIAGLGAAALVLARMRR